MVSHIRIDHYGGMRAIVNEFAPLEFWSAPANVHAGRFEDLEDALDKFRIKRVSLSDDQSCREISGVKFCILYSPSETSDDASVAMRLEFGKVRLIFSGDIQKREEERLLQKAQAIESAVLKVPRHGSAASSSEEFVASIRPKLAVISVGARNAQGLPRDEVLERYRKVGAEILRTDQDGAVIIRTNGNELRYEGYKSGRRGKLTF
jgi:competence protein ComEC